MNTVTFNCSASDDVTYLSNINLWTNSTGTWHRNETETIYIINGTILNTTQLTKTASDNYYVFMQRQNTNSYVLGYLVQWRVTETSYKADVIFEFVYQNGTKLNTSSYRISSDSYTNRSISNPSISLASPFGWNVSNINTYIIATDTSTGVWINYQNITIISNNSPLSKNSSFNYKLTGYTYRNCEASNVDNSCSFDASNYSIHQGLNVNSVSYNTSTLQTSTETFLLQLNKSTSISSINATLYYNGTPYASTTTISGNQVNISNSISIPADISGDIIFYWEITSFGTLGSTTQILGNYTQEVTNFTIYSCTGASPSGLTLNFTLYDESSKNKINGSFESTFTYFMIGGSGTTTQSYNYQSINENKSNWMFCINSSGYNVSFSELQVIMQIIMIEGIYFFKCKVGNLLKTSSLFIVNSGYRRCNCNS